MGRGAGADEILFGDVAAPKRSGCWLLALADRNPTEFAREMAASYGDVLAERAIERVRQLYTEQAQLDPDLLIVDLQGEDPFVVDRGLWVHLDVRMFEDASPDPECTRFTHQELRELAYEVSRRAKGLDVDPARAS